MGQKHKITNRFWGAPAAGTSGTVKAAPAAGLALFVDSILISNAFAGVNVVTVTGPAASFVVALPSGGYLDMHDDDYLFECADGTALAFTSTQAANVAVAGFIARTS